MVATTGSEPIGTGGPTREVGSLELQHIEKEFPGVRAVADVSLTIRPGEVLAVVGENGAGKSTLMRVAAGVYPVNSYSGGLFLEGRPLALRNVADAERAGIFLLPQEVQVVPALTVAENIFLNIEPGLIVRRREMIERCAELLERFQTHVDPQLPMGRLRVGQQQMVMLTRALVHNARVIIFDEPTASLSGPEVAVFFEMIRRMRSMDVACVFVSHRIDEVFAIADRIAIMRNGALESVLQRSEATPKQVVALMVGRDLAEMYKRHRPSFGATVLEIAHYSASVPGDADRLVVADVSLDVRAGEIVGLFGLLGAGRTELASALMGTWRGRRSGELKILGRSVLVSSPRDAVRAGMALLTEDRRRFGLFPNMDVSGNVNVGSLEEVCRWQVINRRDALARTSTFGQSLRIRTASWFTAVLNLSGGNQQKVLLARLLAMKPAVLILDEPTRGIDVGAKAEIFELLNDLTHQGLGVLLISSELHEVAAMSDRIVVLYKGRVTARFDEEHHDEREILEAATGAGVGTIAS